MTRLRIRNKMGLVNTPSTNALARFLHDSDQSARAFAAVAGVHYSRISRYLSGESEPSLAAARKIERASRGAVPISCWGEPLVDTRKVKLPRVVRRSRRSAPDRRSNHPA